MKFNFFAHPTFEPWSWDAPMTTGIGGSETSQIEMAQRLAARGHQVVSYAPTPHEESQEHAGVVWTRCDKVDWTQDDCTWIIYRCPQAVDLLPPNVPAWLVCQDVDYPPMLTPERLERFTRIIALCEDHANFLRKRYPDADSKICVSSNGIRPEVVKATLFKARHEGIVRNPRRMMYASSAERGLWILLYIFERVREIVPDAELHIFYGLQNMEKALSRDPNWSGGEHMREVLDLIEQPGVVHYGRVPQSVLAEEWAKSGVWCYPTMWPETSCITSMDAQAMGAIPIVNPLWALRDNVRHGVAIDGDPYRDLLVRAWYVDEVARMLRDTDEQDAIRREMMPDALEHFSWDRFVKQWESWAAQDMRMPQLTDLVEATAHA